MTIPGTGKDYMEGAKFTNNIGQDVVYWAANKRFEFSKSKFKFPRARTYELVRARSRLYRSQILQVNIRWKALDEIYKIYMFNFLHRPGLNISAKNRRNSC